MGNRYGFNDEESKLLKSLNTPQKIQGFVYALNQHPCSSDSCHSPRVVIHEREADCVDSSLLAAAALRIHGEEPLVMNLSAGYNDYGHCLALFRDGNHWGAITKSDYLWLEFREPIYRNLRELALSYFEGYFNANRRKTLRGYSRPINLSRFDRMNWMTSEENLSEIAEYVSNVSTTELFNSRTSKKIGPVSKKIYELIY